MHEKGAASIGMVNMNSVIMLEYRSLVIIVTKPQFISLHRLKIWPTNLKEKNEVFFFYWIHESNIKNDIKYIFVYSSKELFPISCLLLLT